MGRSNSAAREHGGDSLLNAADAVSLDGVHNLIHEPFNQRSDVCFH
jgi:hypothetical protein